jgi:hypothetical protein
MGWFKDLVKKGAGVVGGAIGFAIAGPAGAAIGFGLGSSVSAGLEGLDAAAAAKDSAKAQRRQAKLQIWQQAMENVRGYQQAVALSGVAAEASGASLESSAAQGTQAALGAQASFNNTMLAQGLQYSNAYYNSQRDMINAQRNAQIYSTLGDLAMQASTIIPSGGAPSPGGGWAAADRAGYGQTGGSGGRTLRPGNLQGVMPGG